MSTIKQQKKILWILFFTMLLLVGLIGIYMILIKTKYNSGSGTDEKVCININEYKRLHSEKNDETPSRTTKIIDDTRDRKVLNDPLYPALNRSEFDVHNSVVEQIQKKNLYNTTQEFTDRYHLVAYVTNQDANKDVNLFFVYVSSGKI